MVKFHQPVILGEVIEYLNVQSGKWYIDCNLGGGGHTQAILEVGGKVLGIDLDPEAIKEVTEKCQSEISSQRLITCQANFTQIQELVAKHHLIDIKGVLFDLGVSTHQLTSSERGFSFTLGSPLDMRMDQTNQSVTAADLINGLHEKELAELFLKYGEERLAKKIAQKIIQQRQQNKISTTKELAEIVASVYPKKRSEHIHPATRVFQALRIAVNDEINNLKQTLPKAFHILSSNGRLVVISFHSLEDRIVKNYFKELATNNLAKIMTPKPITPTEQEIQSNPRCRSAKLRAIEKV